jgi:hypothetical protein
MAVVHGRQKPVEPVAGRQFSVFGRQFSIWATRANRRHRQARERRSCAQMHGYRLSIFGEELST